MPGSKHIIIISILFLTLNASGQITPFRYFTSSDGLIHNRCGNVSQDSAGYIWITTNNGICNYDGRKFKFFPGCKNTYYFAHNNGINLYKGACIMGSNGQGVVKALGNSLTFIYPENSRAGRLMGALQLNDTTWLTAALQEQQLQLVTKNRVQYIALPAGIQFPGLLVLSFLQDVENNIWVSTSKGIIIYEKGDLQKPFIHSFFKNQYINIVKQDPAGDIIVSSDSAVHFVAAQTLKNIKATSPVTFARHTAEITAMGFFSNGDIAFSNYPNGMVIYNNALKLVRKLEKPQLPDIVLWDIFIDREENMWLATENGVYRYSNLDIMNYTLPEPRGSPQIVQGTAFEHSFLLSNNIDLYSLANEKLAKVKIPAGGITPTEFAGINRQIWINDYDPYKKRGNKMAGRYDFANNILSLHDKITSAPGKSLFLNLQSAVVLKNDTVVILSKVGKLLCMVNGKTIPLLLPAAFDSISFVSMAPGNTTGEAVLARREGTPFYIKILRANNNVEVKLLQHIDAAEIGKFSNVAVLMDKDGSIWLATGNAGLFYFEQQQKQYKLTKHFTDPEISSELITCITKDDNGNIWVGSNKGIDKIAFSSAHQWIIHKGIYKNTTLGNYIFFLVEHQGLLHIGTSGGLTTVPANRISREVAPFVYINKINCNGSEVANENAAAINSFNSGENNFNFEFTSPTFINGTQTEYQYKMEGLDADWSAPGENYTVSYHQLPPGKYTFRVRSKNANGRWSANDAVFDFSIKKPFYRHWLFLLLCIAAGAGFIYWLYRQKINKIIAIEKTRSIISKDLHDDVGTTLSNLTLMNAVLQNKIDTKPADAKDMAKKMELISRDMLQSMSDIVWSVNPDNDTLVQLTDRLRLFCGNVFEDIGIAYDINLDQKVTHQKLPMQWRKDIYLVGKEIISNCAKYSKAKNFSLTITATARFIGITAADDGVGFDETIKVKGNGLTNIRTRVNQYKGTAELNSSNGTQWNIKLPLK